MCVSEVSEMVKKSFPKPKMETVDKFAKGGGYTIVSFRPDGRLRGVARACRELHISENTIRSILAHFPIPPEQRKHAGGLWTKQEDFERLKKAYSQLQEARKLLEAVQKYLKDSLIVNLVALHRKRRMKQEMLGITPDSFQSALEQQIKWQIEKDELRESTMEEMFDGALRLLAEVDYLYRPKFYDIRY